MSPVDENDKARDLPERAAKPRHQSELGDGQAGGLGRLLPEACEPTPGQLGYLQTQVAGHRWHVGRCLSGAEDFLPPAPAGGAVPKQAPGPRCCVRLESTWPLSGRYAVGGRHHGSTCERKGKASQRATPHQRDGASRGCGGPANAPAPVSSVLHRSAVCLRGPGRSPRWPRSRAGNGRRPRHLRTAQKLRDARSSASGNCARRSAPLAQPSPGWQRKPPGLIRTWKPGVPAAPDVSR